MSRPFYEKPSDLKKERDAVKPLIELWGLELHKTKPAYFFDFCAHRGKDKEVIAAMEVKCREGFTSSEMDRMGGLFISAHKLMNLRLWMATFSLPIIIIARMSDGLFSYTIKPDQKFPKFKVVIGGRKDRHDPDDIEPCALIPMKNFSKVLS